MVPGILEVQDVFLAIKCHELIDIVGRICASGQIPLHTLVRPHVTEVLPQVGVYSCNVVLRISRVYDDGTVR